MYIPSAESAFYQAWHADEQPHLIRDTAFTAQADSYVAYESFGSQKDRDLRNHENMLGFRPEAIAQYGRILVIGSGLTRHFEREVHELRPDLMVCSIDPLLRYGVKEKLREAIRMSASTTFGQLDRMGYGVDFPYQLLDSQPYFRPGVIAGGIAMARSLQQGLPFRDRSFDEVLALHSLPQYALAEEVPILLDEAVRVMKPGATARFYPFFPEDLPALDTFSAGGGVTKPEVTKVPPYLATDWSPVHSRVVFRRDS